MLVAAAVAALSLDLRSSGLAVVSASFGVVALLLLATVLVLARPGWIGGTLGLLALVYVGHTVLANGSSPAEVAFVSVAILLVGELSQWSIDSRLRGRYEVGMHYSRAAAIAGLGALGLGTVVLSQVAAGLPVPGGIATLSVGVAATVVLLGLISVVALRRNAG